MQTLAPIGSSTEVSWAVGLVLLGTAVAGTLWLAAGMPRGRRLWLPGAFALLTTGSIVGAVSGAAIIYSQTEANQRYFLAPTALFLILLLVNVGRDAPIRSLACAVLLAIGLGNGALRWRTEVWWRPGWPRWADEVSGWQKDPSQPLWIWPPPWTIQLKPLGGAKGPGSGPRAGVSAGPPLYRYGRCTSGSSGSSTRRSV